MYAWSLLTELRDLSLLFLFLVCVSGGNAGRGEFGGSFASGSFSVEQVGSGIAASSGTSRASSSLTGLALARLRE